MAVSREPAGRKERQWLGVNVDQKDLNLDQTSREMLGNPLAVISLCNAVTCRAHPATVICMTTTTSRPQQSFMLAGVRTDIYR